MIPPHPPAGLRRHAARLDERLTRAELRTPLRRDAALALLAVANWPYGGQDL